MSAYALTPKGLIRATVINIEETVQQRSPGDLNPQEGASVVADTQAILEYLEARVVIEPECKGLQEALGDINTVLDVADIEERQLTALGEATIIDSARSIQLLLQ